jgi:hypothetical protein
MAQQPMYEGMPNSPQTELASGIDDIQTTIPLVDSSKLPPAPNLATIGSDETAETILYTGISGNDLTGVTRGLEGDAKAWSAGTKVARNFTNWDYETLINNIGDLASELSDLAGVGRTTETVKGNADDLAAHKAETVTKVFNVQSGYNAIGDGVTDDSAAIQSAIDAANAAGGGTVYFPPNNYKILSTIVLKSNTRLVGYNATLDMSSIALYDTNRYGIRAEGTVGASVLLTSNAKKGEYSFDVTSVTGLAEGDWVQLATQGVNYYPYDGYNVDRGEIKKIRKIVGTTLYFENAIYDDYTVANGAFIKKITFVENVEIEGIKIVGDTAPDSLEHGIYLKYVNGFRIKNCELENQDLYQIALISSIRGEVTGNRLRQSFYDGVTGSIFYAVAVIDCCQWVRVTNNHAERTRHHTVTTAASSGQGRWGQPRFILVNDNIAENLMAGDAGRSWAFEHHGVGDSIVFDGNLIDSCYSGFNVEGGSGVVISNNIIKNWRSTAIEVDSQAKLIKNLIIQGNIIEDNTIEAGGASSPIPIYFNLQAGDVIDNVLITDNIINFDLTKYYALVVTCGSLLNTSNFVISDNLIRNTNQNGGTVYAVNLTNINNIICQDNQIYDSRQGIYATGNEVVIKGNIIDSPSTRALTAGYGIYIGGNDAFVEGNIIRRSYYGMNVPANKTGIIIANNIIRADAVTISDAGTGTVKQNNVEIVY